MNWHKRSDGIVHEFTKGSPWDELGIDLCLGAEADKPIDIRQQMFAPFYMRYLLQSAYIQTPDGGRRPLVLREEKIVDAELETESSWGISPMVAATLFLLLNVIIRVLSVEEANDFLGMGYVIVCSSRNSRLYYCFSVFRLFSSDCRFKLVAGFV